VYAASQETCLTFCWGPFEGKGTGTVVVVLDPNSLWLGFFSAYCLRLIAFLHLAPLYLAHPLGPSMIEGVVLTIPKEP
jgi:hypothetical protein